ncbi:MAG: hypothetical protein ORN85_09000 [Sediminibacterium sp.]|nr:hypothetical protein [Sediminibacterium sp.]
MITPDKYFDLNNSVINVSAAIIRALQKINVLTYNELEKEVHKMLGEDSKNVFLYALNFLFLLDKIEYNNSIYTFTIKK